QVVRAAHEATEVEELVGRRTARRRAQTREIGRKQAVRLDELADLRLVERLEPASLRVGERRREGDPARRLRGDDRISLAAPARRPPLPRAALPRATLARQEPRERATQLTPVDVADDVVQSRADLLHERGAPFGV